MPKTWLLILIPLLLFFIYKVLFSPKGQNQIWVEIKNQKFLLELAKSPGELSRGLSGRNTLCPACGMIFVFPLESTLPFWMKDTLIPLDLIWLNSQGQIVSIQTALPEPNVSATKLKIYQNSNPAKYVIELNAGAAFKINLQVGHIINLPPNL